MHLLLCLDQHLFVILIYLQYVYCSAIISLVPSHVCVLLCRFHPEGMCTDLRKFIDGPSSYLTLPDELKSAIEAITYIAEALQAEKDYTAVSLYVLSYDLFAFLFIGSFFTLFLTFAPFFLFLSSLYHYTSSCTSAYYFPSPSSPPSFLSISFSLSSIHLSPSSHLSSNHPSHYSSTLITSSPS